MEVTTTGTTTPTTDDDTGTTVTTVDARGQSCPGPIVSLAKALRPAESGALFELLATDKGSVSDVPSWATVSGNELVERSQDADVYRFVIRKA